jgi:hypothetical protein
MHFVGRHYRKRDDGVAIAKATPPPGEIQRVLEAFMADTAEDPQLRLVASQAATNSPTRPM